MKKVLLVCMLVFCVTLSNVYAKKGTYDEKINAFFGKVKEGTVEEALFEISAGGLLQKKLAQNKEVLDDLTIKLKSLPDIYGTFTGDAELVREVNAGKRLTRQVYFAYYEEFPVRFIFDFYSTTKNWSLINIEFDTNVTEELTE